jgi:23S rRNA pseudouridine1911/1915/1917 synthase
MEIPIIYEDAEIVVIDKPSGIICNRAETVQVPTLQDWMAAKLDLPIVSQSISSKSDKQGFEEIDYEAYFRNRYGLVHRLDKETSGVMVLAKTVESFVELLRQFREREVQKEYLALTHGLWQSREGEIALPIARRRDDRKKFGVREDGKESVTTYNVREEYKTWVFPKELRVDDRGYAGFSLVSFLPKTGRTHQIRVHARQVGHPLVGDMDYAGRKRSREDRKWAKRVMLQAEKLEFSHPKTKERVSFQSKNVELTQVLAYLSPVI